MVKAPKFCHVTPILKSLHWLKINERIEYKHLSLTYKALTTAYLSAQPDLTCSAPRATRSSSVVTLSQPSRSVNITSRSFRYASPHLWNQLPVSFRQPCTKHPSDDVTQIHLPPALHHTFTVSFQAQNSPFHKSTNHFHHSLLAPTWTAFSDLLGSTVFIFSYFFSFLLGRAARAVD